MLTNGVHNLIKLKRKETTLIGLSCGKPRKEYNGNVLSLKYDYFFFRYFRLAVICKCKSLQKRHNMLKRRYTLNMRNRIDK